MSILSERTKQVSASGTSAEDSLQYTRPRGDPSTMTGAGAEGYAAGYTCGLSQGTYAKATNGPVDPPRIPSHVDCGVPKPQWIVTPYREDGREYSEDVTEQYYPFWLDGFEIGYLDGWDDGRAMYATGGGGWLEPDDSGFLVDPNTGEPVLGGGNGGVLTPIESPGGPIFWAPAGSKLIQLPGDKQVIELPGGKRIDISGRVIGAGAGGGGDPGANAGGLFDIPEGGLERKPAPTATGPWWIGGAVAAGIAAVAGIAWVLLPDPEA
jgi:hypothetical protein